MAGNSNTFGMQPQRGGDIGGVLDAYMKLVEDQTDEAKRGLAISRSVAGAQTQYVSAIKKVAQTLGSAFNVTPRQLIAAGRGNLSNTGRNVGIGTIAAGIGLAGAASPNGLSPLTSSLKLLSATIGGALLPALIDLSAAIAAYADGLNQKDVIDQRQDDIRGVRNVVGGAGALGGAAAGAAAMSWTGPGALIGAGIGGLAGWWAGREGVNAIDKAANPDDYKDQKSFSERFKENRDLLIKGMLSGMGSKGFGGIADAAKKAQEAALGGGLEFKILQAQLKNVQYAAKIAENTAGLNGASS